MLRVLHDALVPRRPDAAAAARPLRRAARLRAGPAHGARWSTRRCCDTVTGDRLGSELRLLLREPQSRRCAVLDALRPGPRAARRRLRGHAGWPSAPAAGAARARRLLHRDRPPRARRAARRTSAFPASDRDVVVAARDGLRAARRLARTPATPSCGARLRARARSRPSQLAGARGRRAAARALARRRPPPPAGDHRRRPGRRRARPAPAVGDGARRARRTAMLDGRAPDREAQLARRPYASDAVSAARARSAGRTTRSSPTCRTPRRASSRPRRGGVSARARYDSLNLGLLTDDAPRERRPRTGAGSASASAIRGRASATAARSTARRCGARPSRPRPSGRTREEDGQATALRRRRRARLHRRLPAGRCSPPTAPWRRCTAAGAPLAGGIVDEGVRALREVGGDGPITAALGPARAAAATRSARRSTRTSRPTTRAAATQPRPRGGRARAARGRTAIEVHDVGLCTMCDDALLLPPPRPAASPAARRGSRGAPDHRPRRRAHPRQPRARARRDRRRRAATPPTSSSWPRSSTSPLEELGALAEAGLTLARREPRPGARGQGRRRIPSFRWHFIGQLQCRKVKQILPHVELIHSVASESALRSSRATATPTRGSCVEVNVAGEDGQGGHRARRARRATSSAARSRSPG